ncbi:transposase [Vibrio crassostreae]|uniref:Transposase n=1 Tax=Vibrio crassostreae TaxID=246167 RepID=A0A822MTZ4_9VIBR|nr:transposase [Vibrio crassostreae]CAK3865920.1 transposase [Vibrio crassostreae]CDS98285.1 hypothetical protein VCR5J5_1320001 [Vibrio crassostreae]
MMFKGCHFPSEVILETVRYYIAYKLSYREIEEIQRERGVTVDHATINRWVLKFSPILEHKARRRKKPCLVLMAYGRDLYQSERRMALLLSSCR